MSASTCGRCGRAIRWITTPAGKSMPLDEAPVTMWMIVGDNLGNGPSGINPSAKAVQVRRNHMDSCIGEARS